MVNRTSTTRDLFTLLKESAWKFQADEGPRRSAAIAFHAAFSLSPLLLLMVALVGRFFGAEAARGEVAERLRETVGREAAEFIQQRIIQDASGSGSLVAALVSSAILLYAASGIFGEIRGSLNTIWKVPCREERTGWWQLVREQALAFLLIGGSSLLLLVSLVATAVLAGIQDRITVWMPGPGSWVQWGDLLLNVALATALFAMIFKWLPDVRLDWRDVWAGAAVTAILFSVARHLIGLYLGKAAIYSTYGAAGAFVGLLLWMYYSAEIFLFGAELTFHYAQRFGSGIRTAHGTRIDLDSSTPCEEQGAAAR